MALWPTTMRELLLIGIGTGNPDHVTGEAIKALQSADLILIPRKGPNKDDLADLRRSICDVVLTDPVPQIVEFDLPKRRADGDYIDAVEDWHDAIARAWTQAAGTEAARVALLIWGDPSLYDSSLRIAERLSPTPKVRFIPGITSIQALTAAHAIPVNTLAAPFTVTTGRRLRADGWPEGAETVVIMLDAGGAYEVLNGADYDIWWGAYLGMDNQILEAGPLDEAGPRISAVRKTAREAHGWIMDCYLIRPRNPAP